MESEIQDVLCSSIGWSMIIMVIAWSSGSSMAQATRRGHLHRKLEKKLDAMSSDRHASVKKKSK